MEQTISMSRPTFSTFIAWLLFVTLIGGAYVFYAWCGERLQAQVAAQETQLADASAAVKTADAKRAESEQVQETLRAEIVALTAEHEALIKTDAELEHDLNEIKATQADTLAAEQAKTEQIRNEKDQLADAHAALQSRYEAATEQVMGLQSDLSKINKVIAANAAEHQAKIKELEQHINARIQLAQTTPMDVELLRTAQALGILPPDETQATKQQAMTVQLATVTSKLEALQAEYEAVRTQLTQTQTQVEEQLQRAEIVPEQAPIEVAITDETSSTQTEELAAVTATLAALQADYDAVRIQLAQSQEHAQEQLQHIEKSFEQERLAAVTALDEMKTAHADALAEAEQRLAELAAQPSQDDNAPTEELAALQAQIDRDAALIADLKAKIASAEQAVASETNKAAQQIAALNEQLVAGQQAQDALNEKLNAVSEKLAAAESQLQTAQASAAPAEQDESALTQEMAAAKAQIVALEASLEEERVKAAKTQDALNEKLNAVSEKLVAAENQLQTAQSAQASETPAAQDDSALTQEIAAAKAQIIALEASLEEERVKAAKAQDAARGEASAVASLRALYTGFAELGGTFTERGLLLRLAESELRFTGGSATLPAGKFASLDRIAALLAEQPALTVRIEGHTDSLGGNEINLPLSRQRAVAVQDALIERGVDATRLTADGLGASRAIAENTTAAGRSKNRRVEIYVME